MAFRRRVAALSTSLIALSIAGCTDAPAAPAPQPEVVAASFQSSVSFDGQRFPAAQLIITASGTSSLGKVVAVSALTVDGAAVTSPLLVSEGSHAICVTATSSTGTTATSCRSVQVAWPRFQGRSVLLSAQGIVTPPGLTLTVDDVDAYPITSTDGSFSIPSSKALLSGTKLLFTGNGSVAPSIVRSAVTGLNVVMLPTQLSIPGCSVYGGQSITLDLEKAFAPAAAGQTAFFDRISTMRNTGKVIVASWNSASIPVALSDTGGATRRFSASDSAEVATVLTTLTAYYCQNFHLAPVAVASAGGVVIVKDPGFAALGAHSMAVPTIRGDYTRAEVVLRRIVPDDPAARDSTRRTIMHEFTHVLGFGHSCSWPTIMTTGTICAPSTYTFVPSPQDVAHYFAMVYARQAERAQSSLESLGPAYVAALMAKGQPELLLVPYFSQP